MTIQLFTENKTVNSLLFQDLNVILFVRLILLEILYDHLVLTCGEVCASQLVPLLHKPQENDDDDMTIKMIKA